MNDNKPLVSVIMAVYNGERYVQKAIDSILAQTFTDFEFLIINDASTDKTAAILTAYRDERLRVYTNELNIGLARSLNRGIELTRGRYIARQDADDISYPERLEKQVAFLESHPKVGVIGTTTDWIDDDDKLILIWRQPTDNAHIQETMLRYCCLVHGSTMYRQEAVQEAGAYDATMRTGQDYDLWLRLSETWDLVSLSAVLYSYRRHTGMASVIRGDEQQNHAQGALVRALQRRKSYIKSALGLGRNQVPPRLRYKTRRQHAQLYTWWSSGIREYSRQAALTFLLAAFMFDPSCPSLWVYLKGIVERKVRKLIGQETRRSIPVLPEDALGS